MTRTRNQVPEEERWNIGALYLSQEDWEKNFKYVAGANQGPRWPKLKAYEEKFKKSPPDALQFFENYFVLERELTKLYVYAHLKFDEDLGNDEAKEKFGRISSLLHDFQLEYSWVEPELLSLSEEDYQRLRTHKKNTEYKFYFEKIWRMRSHTREKEIEELIALSGKALEASQKAFNSLNNADLTFADAETSFGEKKKLTPSSYNMYMRSSDRALRKSAFESINGAYAAHINTICELLQGQVEKHFFIARAKQFNTCVEAALFPFGIDTAVYETLISSVHQNLETLHNYIQIRKKALDLDELHMYDLYVPLVEEEVPQRHFQEACQLVVESVVPLGKEYAEILKNGLFKERWVDPFENEKKRSGAYSSGCYDSMPYILMNYQGTLSDVLTLAHEAGHSMHSYLSRKHQSYINADYPIFVAEVASTFNEQLLLKLLREQAKTKKELAYLVNYEIEAIRTTIFRQTLFAEFELQLHRWIEEGRTLTPTLLKECYIDLNRKYYGTNVILDGGIEYEWARIPHFYNNFYVYQYATGLSAALALFEQVEVSEEARIRYIEFLSSGGSHYPLDLLKRAGVNLRDSSAIDSAMKRFAFLIEELKKLIE